MRAIAIAVVVLLWFAPLASGQSKRSVDSLKRSLSKMQSEKRKLQDAIRKKQREAKAVMGDIQRVDGRLGQLEGQLEDTTAKLSAGRREQIELEERLSIANAQLTEARARLRQRLKAMAIHRNASPISVLLSAEDFGEFACRRSVLEAIAVQDRELFARVEALQSEVAARKRRQDEVVDQVRTLQVRQVGEQRSLEGARNEKQRYLGELRVQQAELRKQYDELDRESDRIAARIRAYQARRTPGPPLVFRGGFSRPVAGRITSGFGYRMHPILRERRFHAGVDFGAPSGTPISAAAAGVVIEAGYVRGYGNVAIVDHGSGVSTLYGHCSRLFVRAGQRVARGERIAAVGSTGLSTGPHLHFEVRVNGRPVNPIGRL